MVCLANRTASRFLRRAPQTAHAAARSIRDKRAPTGSLTRQRNRYSSSSSQQAGLQRRPARPKRQLALILLRRSALQVRQDLRNELRLLDAGDDLQLPAAAPFEPAQAARRLVEWFSTRPLLGLNIFLVVLPAIAFLIGCATVLRSWRNGAELRQAA